MNTYRFNRLNKTTSLEVFVFAKKTYFSKLPKKCHLRLGYYLSIKMDFGSNTMIDVVFLDK